MKKNYKHRNKVKNRIKVPEFKIAIKVKNQNQYRKLNKDRFRKMEKNRSIVNV